MLGQPGIGVGLEAAHGDQAHGLGAAGQHHAVSAAADAQIGQGDGFKTGGAKAVYGDAGNLHRQAGAQSGKAGDIPALLALRLGTAQDDVVDLGAVEGGQAIQGRVQGECGKVVGAGGGESAFGGAAYRGAHGADENGFRHGECSLKIDRSVSAEPTLPARTKTRRGWGTRCLCAGGAQSGTSSRVQAFLVKKW
jgi:hypothetical protein